MFKYSTDQKIVGGSRWFKIPILHKVVSIEVTRSCLELTHSISPAVILNLTHVDTANIIPI